MMDEGVQLLDLADHRVGYVDIPGAREKTPLVLLHGGGLDHRMWSPQLRADLGRRTIAPDARGHGASSPAETPHRLADDVAWLLDALGIDRAILAGVSMGGGTAVDVALEHPSRVAALVVSGTGTSEPSFTDPWVLETLEAWKEAEAQGDIDAWIRAFMRFSHGPERTPDDVDRSVWDAVEAMVSDTMSRSLPRDDDGLPALPTPPTPVTGTWERLSGITVPVLALAGALDSIDHRRPGRCLADAVPVGQYTEVADSAHYPNLENPAAFNAAMANMLSHHSL
ncbi:alpha/beta fold hydrolase [Brevibacterium jeotgali]|nr:alpha/beta hydrolase [Brevibacterium jeotgali]TWC01686.1 pimeloyl-ACP methyl ester carboxylesterase [Brevibacterium jeotgali]